MVALVAPSAGWSSRGDAGCRLRSLCGSGWRRSRSQRQRVEPGRPRAGVGGGWVPRDGSARFECRKGGLCCLLRGSSALNERSRAAGSSAIKPSRVRGPRNLVLPNNPAPEKCHHLLATRTSGATRKHVPIRPGSLASPPHTRALCTPQGILLPVEGRRTVPLLWPELSRVGRLGPRLSPQQRRDLGPRKRNRKVRSSGHPERPRGEIVAPPDPVIRLPRPLPLARARAHTHLTTNSLRRTPFFSLSISKNSTHAHTRDRAPSHPGDVHLRLLFAFGPRMGSHACALSHAFVSVGLRRHGSAVCCQSVCTGTSRLPPQREVSCSSLAQPSKGRICSLQERFLLWKQSQELLEL